MACRMSLTAVSVSMTLCAILFNALGIFLKEWWIDFSKTKYGLLTVVSCQNYVCSLGSDETDGWIVFVRVSAYAEFVTLIGALLTMVTGRLCRVTWFMNVSVPALAIACTFSLLHTFTLISYYPKLTDAVQVNHQLPKNTVFFQTLPLGLVAISGSFCVPAFVGLAIRQTKEKAEAGKKNAVV